MLRIIGIWCARSRPETLFFPDMVLTPIIPSLAPLPGNNQISILGARAREKSVRSVTGHPEGSFQAGGLKLREG